MKVVNNHRKNQGPGPDDPVKDLDELPATQDDERLSYWVRMGRWMLEGDDEQD